ncbi:MAG TPA: thioredoxin-disulfide reductase [Peptococcaceae bacterium]|nr:MAG: Thioredoxin reductase [Moorella sp. 60_41]HBT47915.1 thioredoxin-disulfide reductase [Peptococcaceae bacterium]
MDCDLLVLGGGPAGLTAGLYGARGGLRTVILERGIPGGWAGQTDRIENYPGFPEGIDGMDLAARFAEQARRCGAQLETATVTGVDFGGPQKRVLADGREFTAGAVIVATGASPRSLQVPGEETFRGRGVSYCATCDGAFFRGKKVAVVGGGDSAVEEALFLTRFAAGVTIIHRRDRLRAAQILQRRAMENPKITFYWSTTVEAILGGNKVETLRLRDVQSGTVREEEFDGIFIFIGQKPNTDFLQGILELDEQGYIITREDLSTSVAGVYAAGDVRSKAFRQVATAVGDGAAAAMAAEKYLADLTRR